MENEIFISIKGSFGVVGEGALDTPEIEVISRGNYYERGGNSFVLYEELSEGFNEPIKNLLKISSNEVSIKKSGLINTFMEFVPGSMRESHYVTPYGNLVMGIITNMLVIKSEEHEIKIEAGYELELNYAKAGDCHINIHIADSAIALEKA